MKRIRNITALLAFVIIGISACQKDPETQCSCGEMEINKKEYIAMCIIPEEVTATSVNTLRIENCTKEEMVYGVAFSMEYLFEDNWIPIEWDLNFIAIAYSLSAGKIEEIQMNLYALVEKYNESKTGMYRIIKNVGKYNLTAEFEIK